MPGDPHPRSAHRAGPAGGLASLTPQGLVRQAQAGHARARQAIIRQAMARRTRGHRAPDRHRHIPGRTATIAVTHDGDDLHPGPRHSGRETAGLRTVRLRPVGLQTVVRLAAEFQAAQIQSARFPETRVPGTRTPGVRLPGHRFLGSRRPAGHLPAVESPAVEWADLHPTVADRPATPQHRLSRSGQWPAAATHQRHALQRRVPREPQQALQTVMRGLAALIVLAIVGLSAFFIVAEQRRGNGRDSVALPGSEPRITSRAVDPEPLTQHEVFPEPTVRLAAGDAGYPVQLTHSDTVCRTATVGELGGLLDDYGCDHVVRARLAAPHGGYLVTAGVFNLADDSGAAQVSELAGTLVENGRGTFTMLGGSAGDPLGEPLAQVGWHSRGHYLLYCVIARPDGQLVADDDPYAARITTELVERYLGAQVIGARTLDP
ncbi:hypothetical protein [Actinoplanes auranticolor]|uniref:Uncharacterized protein n=1 Tax=Actinoplanes auranticolor TaxID=47988 RepID=A0A919S446_9ACTN|nr:hypothetical protein [Actinoplanes auranticolor]GIM64699.1 hypothetical protein Aau02nite_12100 [Actinoplanes auranticolor]